MKVAVDVQVILMANRRGELVQIPEIPPSSVVKAVMSAGGGHLSLDLCADLTFTDVPVQVDGFGVLDHHGELLMSQPLAGVARPGDSVNITGSGVLDDDVPTSTLDDMTTDPDTMTMEEWLDAAPTPGDAVTAAAAVDEADDAVAELVNWLRGETWSDFATSLAQFYDDRGYLSPKQVASATKMRVKVEAKRTTATPTEPVTEDGMYLHPDGTVYKVQIAHHGSGRLYAKRLVVSEDYGTPARFEFDQGAIRRLTPSMKMTLEQAQAFGSLYGVCCVCAAVLTNEQSIADGIGPICRTRVF